VSDILGVHHLSLSVTDRVASAAWYGRVLGFAVHSEVTTTDFERTRLRHPVAGLTVTLTEHRATGIDRFDPRRVGIDHLALQVADIEDVHTWAERLDGLGVDRSPVKLRGHPPQSALVAFTDPDGIQLEIFAVAEP
jgi:glyoxylase I family protein